MFKKISYIFTKIIIKLIIKLGFFKRNGCALYSKRFLFKTENITKSNSKSNSQNIKIAVVFLDPKLTHIGDQIFFDPLIQNLTAHFNSDNVSIFPTKQMKKYFEFFHKNVFEANEFNPDEYDLIITRVEEWFNFKNLSQKTIFINTVEKSLKNRITNEITNSVFALLNLTTKVVNCSPRVPLYSNEFEIDKTKKYLLYNNYVDSGWFRIQKRDIKTLEEFAIQMSKKHDLTILHIGTLQDKNTDKRILSYQDYLDYRGKTSVEDIFSLLALENIKMCVTFDTFVFHAAILTDTQCFVKIKNSSSNKLKFLLRCILPCIPMDNLYKKIIFIDEF